MQNAALLDLYVTSLCLMAHNSRQEKQLPLTKMVRISWQLDQGSYNMIILMQLTEKVDLS